MNPHEAGIYKIWQPYWLQKFKNSSIQHLPGTMFETF